jgi:hypothetical protein
MCVFHSHIQSIEREKNFVLEILNILSDMQNILQEKKNPELCATESESSTSR